MILIFDLAPLGNYRERPYQKLKNERVSRKEIDLVLFHVIPAKAGIRSFRAVTK